MRLIDADELVKNIPNEEMIAKMVVAHAPTIEQPQGEWIHNPNGIDRDFIWWKCSNCGNEIFSETEYDREKFHAFCGRCGARMKGDH